MPRSLDLDAPSLTTRIRRRSAASTPAWLAALALVIAACDGSSGRRTGGGDAGALPDTAFDISEGDITSDALTHRDATSDGPAGDGRSDAARDADASLGDDANDTEAGLDTESDAPPDADGSSTPGGVAIERCGPLPIPSATRCDARPGTSGALRISGTIVTQTVAYEGGDVLIDASGRIACVGCDCEGEESDGATRLICPNAVVSPGLINTHDHLGFTQNPPGSWGDERFEHRHDWRRGQNGHRRIRVAGGGSREEVAWGELRQLIAGTTSIAGAGGVDGLLRNLDRETEGLGDGLVELATFPLGDSGGSRRDMGCGYDFSIDGADLDEGAWELHVAEGIGPDAANEYRCLSSSDRGGVDAVEPGVSFVHAMAVTPRDASELAASRTAVSWSPRSNISLYGMTAPVTMLRNVGVRLTLGTDWTVSGSINLLRELACARALNEQHYDEAFSSRDLWRMVTVDAAGAFELDARIGTLRIGAVGDIAIYDGVGFPGQPYRAVVEAGLPDVVAVIRGGELLYGDAGIFDSLSLTDRDGCERLDEPMCGVERGLCLEDEIGLDFAALSRENADAYELYFCETPRGEPTCVPSRPGEFDGGIVVGDRDGDGVPDADDLCPAVFDPPRLIDPESGADADGDGIGDACDPCPLLADSDTCSPPTLDDVDGDGFPTDSDNCPRVPNADQADRDEDGVGDACDECPGAATSPGAACPVSIYAIKRGEIPLGTTVSAQGRVTAVMDEGLFMQTPVEARDDAFGVRHSAIFVFVERTPPAGFDSLEIGDLVSVTGRVEGFFGRIEISDVEAIDRIATSRVAPAPTTVDTTAIGPDGELAGAYEALLVRVEEVEVVAVNPAAGPGESDPTNAVVVDGGLWVDDAIHRLEPLPDVGEVLDVVGVHWLANEQWKVEPRGPDDVTRLVTRAPRLLDAGVDATWIEAGAPPSSGHPPIRLTLDRPAPTGGVEIIVEVEGSDALEIATPLSVPPGATSLAPRLSSPAGSGGDATLTFRLGEESATVTVTVVAPDRTPAVERLEPESLETRVGESASVRIFLDSPAPMDGLDLAIGGSAVELLELTEELRVEEWTRAVELPLAARAAGVGRLRVEAPGGASEIVVNVAPRPRLGFILSEVLYDVSGDDNGLEWIELHNDSTEPLDLSGWSIGAGGEDYLWSTYQLTGTIPAGGCWVVGGPRSEDANFSPELALARDFDADLQNSGGDADGVALFDMPASELTASSVPTDVVIYGEVNANGLLGPDGDVAPVDIGDVGRDASMERVVDGWRRQERPTPNDCGPAIGVATD